MKKLDFEAHYYPPALMDFFSARTEYPIFHPEIPEILLSDDFSIKDAYKLYNLYIPLEDRIKIMDEHGVTAQVLSLSPGLELLNEADSIRLARMSNDYVYQATQSYSGRFLGFAALPIQNIDASVAELERCIKELGFVGWLFFSNFGPAYADDDRFSPIFDKAAELGALVYLHPTQPSEGRTTGLGPQLAAASFGFGIDTSVTLMRLILKGVFDRNPTLKLLVGHLGEIFPFILKRIDERAKNYPRQPAVNEQLPGYYFKNNIWVTTSGQYSHEAFQCTKDVLGIEHILFGSDFPYEYPEEVDEFCDNLSISKVEQEKLFFKNAEDFFGIHI